MTRSSEPARTWDDNWRLLRQLWPAWEPTAETTKHVWFTAYDKPHGVEGPRTINQVALREAIIDAARSQRWKEPTFYDINNIYKRLKNEQITARTTKAARSKVTAEQLEIQKEHERRMVRIGSWTPDRLLAARNEVARRFASFRGYSKDLKDWSPFYSGLLCAIDQEQREATR